MRHRAASETRRLAAVDRAAALALTAASASPLARAQASAAAASAAWSASSSSASAVSLILAEALTAVGYGGQEEPIAHGVFRCRHRRRLGRVHLHGDTAFAIREARALASVVCALAMGAPAASTLPSMAEDGSGARAVSPTHDPI